jgi:hypothetical protein
MRTKTLLLSAAALAAGVFASQAQTSNVYSANVVGYINRQIVTGGVTAQYSLVANHLQSGNDVLSNLLSTLPANSKVLKFNAGTQAFVTFTKTAFGSGWSPTTAGSNTLALGEGAFITLPNGANLTNTFVGTVFQADGVTTPAFVNVLPPGFSLQSFPVPVSMAVTNPAVNLNGALPGSPTGSKMLTYNEAGQSYTTFTRTAFGTGWSPSVPSVSPGVAFFIFNAASTNRFWTNTFLVQ